MSAREVPLAISLPGAGTIVAALLGALLAIAVLVALMRRHQQALPLLIVAALPFRLPISADGRTVNLLIPIYLVVVAGALAHLLGRGKSVADTGSPGMAELSFWTSENSKPSGWGGRSEGLAAAMGRGAGSKLLRVRPIRETRS